ncbi:MAG: protein translocase subunit SecD [Rhodothermales bacterium]|nr:protein translocase subunit SecD [Rhodothermales bacterium]
MQDNGLKIGLTAFFLVLSAYYLWPSFQNMYYSRQMDGMDETELAEYTQENFTKLASLKERSLNLGLDLQGGMHVTLEVQVEALIRELATDIDEVFDDVMLAARDRVRTGNESFIDAFVDEFEARDPNALLSRYFRSEDDGITRRSSNSDVAAYLQAEANDAVNRAIEIIRDRVDRYGVTEPSIQKQGTRRVIVELPGVDDAERVRNLLKGTARLEFRLMAEPEEIVRSLQNIIEYYEEEVADSTATADSAAADSTGDFLLDDGIDAPANPFLDVVSPVGQGTVFGMVSITDSSAANALLREPAVAQLLPPNTTLMYTSSPIGVDETGREIYYLLGVRDQIEMTGDVIEDSSVQFDQMTNAAQVSMTMDGVGSRTWARITGANVGKQIAIVLDGVVYSYPVVNERIVGGRSSIEGLDSQEEASDIVTILKSGALPAPVDIIEERTVGPSLGAASIRSGFRSVVVGLLIVAIFMIVYYRTGGIVADLALILNILFILGILAGFKATITLPGIAGIVLTIGMAVDANVLIFERIREEQATGKTLKASIEGGYAKALSAIFDANITTFFVGAILYSFGVGPIQGFAVTLMAGILASMFSAIIITRIVIDYMVVGKRLGINFG